MLHLPEGSEEVVEQRGRVVISPMRRRHLRGVLAIEQRTNHRPWSLGLFLGELRMPTSRAYVVALDAHRVIGFAGLMLTAEGGHLTNIAVHPGRRREGIGDRLMLVTMREAVRRGLDSVTLEVRMTNSAAQEMYRKFGFAPGGVRRNYYADVGEDALIMWAHRTDSEEFSARLCRIERDLTQPLVTDGVTP
jgi:[ribosomal protein S18]-alanine N-acetyltransferase